jgi:hypothetical protein
MGSGFDDWVYRHFFTITLNYNSSHIEIVCLTNFWLIWIPQSLNSSQIHIATDGQLANKSWCRAPSGAHDQIFITVWQL